MRSRRSFSMHTLYRPNCIIGGCNNWLHFSVLLLVRVWQAGDLCFFSHRRIAISWSKLMKQFLKENSYRKEAFYCLQSRYGSVDILCQDLWWCAISKNSRVFNFAIFLNSWKFHACEIYMVYSKFVICMMMMMMMMMMTDSRPSYVIIIIMKDKIYMMICPKGLHEHVT